MNPLTLFTPRQFTVACAFMRYLDPNAAANYLNISVKTFNIHLQRMYKILHVVNNLQFVECMLYLGINFEGIYEIKDPAHYNHPELFEGLGPGAASLPLYTYLQLKKPKGVPAIGQLKKLALKPLSKFT